MEEVDKLKQVSRYLIYYIRMYFETLDWLNNNSRIEGWDLTRNAILDAHLQYSRNLIEFLTEKGNHDDDISAYSYFENAELFPVQCPLLNKYRKKLSKQIAHVVHGFPIKSEQKFEIYKIAEDLRQLLVCFFMNVQDVKIFPGIKQESLERLQLYQINIANDDISPST